MKRFFKKTSLLRAGFPWSSGKLSVLFALPFLLGTASVLTPSSGDGEFTYTGSLNMGRASHTASLLPNGNVLVAGGSNSSIGDLNSAELYNTASGSWTATGNLNSFRGGGHTATLLSNGKVLVAGGYHFGVGASAEVYDTTNGIWTATGSLNIARYVHTASLLPNGKVLVAGGLDSNAFSLASAELYDPSSGIWTATGSLNSARGSHTATLLPDGRVLVAGGYLNHVGLGSAELYDPASAS